ncbi:uncharacterized protein TM35_000381810 [Trypanosoma theileri]|uniref:Uncharacterized protein n=1 Tax=Trypanosoma theileri TaxID=67003 RepID=A0A1X0NK98_9TRYP|nr:uncharacterized protein TM35_000381810 [Trypanosoma theileri]ORC85106.1 hypothetical protein TM35_000381810 [Trypanosoma theileri]
MTQLWPAEVSAAFCEWVWLWLCESFGVLVFLPSPFWVWAPTSISQTKKGILKYLLRRGGVQISFTPIGFPSGEKPYLPLGWQWFLLHRCAVFLPRRLAKQSAIIRFAQCPRCVPQGSCLIQFLSNME